MIHTLAQVSYKARSVVSTTAMPRKYVHCPMCRGYNYYTTGWEATQPAIVNSLLTLKLMYQHYGISIVAADVNV